MLTSSLVLENMIPGGKELSLSGRSHQTVQIYFKRKKNGT